MHTHLRSALYHVVPCAAPHPQAQLAEHEPEVTALREEMAGMEEQLKQVRGMR
jgi:hypothetical protein